jgi:multidrug efflux pump subunit AcrA (membrane-fusion protein)
LSNLCDSNPRRLLIFSLLSIIGPAPLEPDTPMKKTSRVYKFLILLSIVTLAAGGAGWGLYHRKNKKAVEALEKRTVKVETKDIKKELVLTGKVLPSSSAAVYSPTSGQIKEIFVQEGQAVKKDQNLFSVIQDTSGQRELEASQNEVAKSSLEVRVAQETVDRKKSVRDLFSEAENRRDEDELARRRLEFQAAVDRLDLLKERFGLEGRNTQRSKSGDSIIFVKSPKDGVVTLINRSVGESVLATNESADSSGREVMTVSDLEKIIVRSRILEADLAAVKMGMSVEVKLDAYRDSTYQGTISRISQQGVEDRNAGYTYFVTDVTFDRPDANVRSQMNATLVLNVDERKQVKTLPALAVATMGQHSVVEMRKGTTLETEYRAVKTGLSNETDVEILDEDIKPQEAFLEIDFSKLDLKSLAEGKLGKNDKLSKR